MRTIGRPGVNAPKVAMKPLLCTLLLACHLYASGAEIRPAACPDAARAQAAGFDAAALCAVLAGFATTQTNFHAIVVERHGVVVAQAYRRGKDASIYSLVRWPTTFDADRLHDVRSISKSVTSLLWGIADGAGRMPPLATPVRALLPAQAPLLADGRAAITLEHLFNMSSGLAWNEQGAYHLGNDEFGLYWRASQEDYVFDRRLDAAPGTRFNYNGGGTAVLARLLQARVGMSLGDYARLHLFEPLGITQWAWRDDMRGRPLAFSGLRMRPVDLARIGRLVLQGGQWQGRQLVPAAWIAQSLRAPMDTGDGLAYGYQWWAGHVDALGASHRWHGGMGNGGQRLYMVPALDLVVVITAGEYNQDGIGRATRQLFGAVAASVRR